MSLHSHCYKCLRITVIKERGMDGEPAHAKCPVCIISLIPHNNSAR